MWRNTFSVQTRLKIRERADWYCECRCKKCLKNEKLSIHHIISNSKRNRKKYGNEIIQHHLNGVVLCHFCHANCKHKWNGQREKVLRKINQELLRQELGTYDLNMEKIREENNI